jgi:hypothetical protein
MASLVDMRRPRTATHAFEVEDTRAVGLLRKRDKPARSRGVLYAVLVLTLVALAGVVVRIRIRVLHPHRLRCASSRLCAGTRRRHRRHTPTQHVRGRVAPAAHPRPVFSPSLRMQGALSDNLPPPLPAVLTPGLFSYNTRRNVPATHPRTRDITTPTGDTQTQTPNKPVRNEQVRLGGVAVRRQECR